MTRNAYELLALIFAFRTFKCPELTPRPTDLRIHPGFSDALDYLIDSGYVIVSWMSQEVPHGNRQGLNSIYHHGLEILAITEDGIIALGSSYKI